MKSIFVTGGAGFIGSAFVRLVLDEQPDLRAERTRYKTVCCTPELLVQIARTPMNFALPAQESREQSRHAEDWETPEPAYAGSGHNEIEEFLL